jgi:geranylgeranyl pyrophosphate synthase
MEATDFQKLHEAFILKAERAIDSLLPPADTHPARLHTAMRYSMQAGGKRLRPTLCLAAAEAFSSQADARYAATAVECIHTYSLIHDDLPCMDNSDLRRGRLSCHKAFDEATALLAGDALLPLSFQLLAQGYAANAELARQLIVELSIAAGSSLLVGGQAEDMQTDSTENEEHRLEYVLQGKTAAMIAAPLAMGAMIGGGSKSDIEHCRRAGRAAGIAFQLVDDLLDQSSNAEKMGKPVGADTHNGKFTFVRLKGVKATEQRIQTLTEEALQHLQACQGKMDFLCALVANLATRDR